MRDHEINRLKEGDLVRFSIRPLMEHYNYTYENALAFVEHKGLQIVTGFDDDGAAWRGKDFGGRVNLMGVVSGEIGWDRETALEKVKVTEDEN